MKMFCSSLPHSQLLTLYPIFNFKISTFFFTVSWFSLSPYIKACMTYLFSSVMHFKIFCCWLSILSIKINIYAAMSCTFTFCCSLSTTWGIDSATCFKCDVCLYNLSMSSWSWPSCFSRWSNLFLGSEFEAYRNSSTSFFKMAALCWK